MAARKNYTAAQIINGLRRAEVGASFHAAGGATGRVSRPSVRSFCAACLPRSWPRWSSLVQHAVPDSGE